jgi:ABC-type multidrug transport system fused ATPase/permease subunit
MEHGRIVEHGSHAQLMLHDGPYRRMSRLQSEPAGSAA